MPLINFDSSILPTSTRRALTFFYRSRFTRNYSTRYMCRAVALVREAAEAGNVSAMSFLGLIYGDAWGVPEDSKVAVHWLRQAAKAGHPLAQFNLAVAYDNGIGVVKNPVKAWREFHKAADSGYADAQFSLAHMLFSGQGVVQNFDRARFWANAAAQQGHAEAMQLLGTCFIRGLGGPILLQEAESWLRQAVEVGSSTALKRLLELWAQPENHTDPTAQLLYLEQLIEADKYKQVQIHAVYALGCLGLQFPKLLPAHRPDAKHYFRWASQFGHEAAALQLAQLEGE